jgi:hypothetical protein
MGDDEDDEDIGDESDPAAAHWFRALVLSSFVAVAHEELKIRKMSAADRDVYVDQNSVRLRKSITTSGYTRQALNISAALKEPETKGRMQLLECLFVVKMRIRTCRKRAGIVHACLTKWSTIGTLFLLLKRFGTQIRFVQRWWRKVCLPRLAAARSKLNQRWIRLEKALIVQDIKARDQKERINAGIAHWEVDDPTHPHVMTMENRIQLQLISDADRACFIEHELRARRYFILPQIALWEEDMRAWNKEVAEFQETNKALHVVGAQGMDQPAFRWPSQRPSHMPQGQKEVLDMIYRCRAHPNRCGWKEIPKKVPGETSTVALGAVLQSAGNDDDHPFGQATYEDLQAHQLADEDLPLEFRETAPGVKVPECQAPI